jgi:hypothetical protein
MGSVYLAEFPKEGEPMTLFKALMIALAFGLVIMQ